MWGLSKLTGKVTPPVTPPAAAVVTPAPAPATLKSATVSIAASPKRRRQPEGSPQVARIWLRDRETPPPSRPTARQHALQLLRWVHGANFAGSFVLYEDLGKIYAVMCEELGWAPYAWQTVAPDVREMTGGKKSYKWVWDDAEQRSKRRRAYLIPHALAKRHAAEFAKAA